jgi:hypothetical protein
MAGDSTRDLLRIVGPAWIAAVLVATIVGAFSSGLREFLGSLSLIAYLLVFWGAMVPGVVILYLAERNRGQG